jgi:hypothetical protein
MGWTAKEAADELGLSQGGYAAYERGWVPSRYDGWPTLNIPRPIPKHVALACERLEWIAEEVRGENVNDIHI